MANQYTKAKAEKAKRAAAAQKAWETIRANKAKAAQSTNDKLAGQLQKTVDKTVAKLAA